VIEEYEWAYQTTPRRRPDAIDLHTAQRAQPRPYRKVDDRHQRTGRVVTPLAAFAGFRISVAN
jgi:hypothetical protein